MLALQVFLLLPLLVYALEDASYWHDVGMRRLQKIVSDHIEAQDQSYTKKAKNIIFFLGDGMGVTTATAGRIFKGQQPDNDLDEAANLIFDEFPKMGMAKTYCVDSQVADSAASATALFTGIKTKYGVVGMDATSTDDDAFQGQVSSIMQWAQSVGKRTGFVTTARVTHDTPAALYAHVYHRQWECEVFSGSTPIHSYRDVASQLVENPPGSKLNVIMGGGLAPMGHFDAEEVNMFQFSDYEDDFCERKDGRDLVLEWLDNAAPDKPRAFVQKREHLLQLDLTAFDSLMGLFRNSHMNYQLMRSNDEPTLIEMVEAALQVLDRGTASNGYVLMVEGARIDMAHHQNYARIALNELLEFDAAVEAALDATNPEETLIIVAADHSHSISFNGYSTRGNDILGVTSKNGLTPLYETLMYSNGPGYQSHIDIRHETVELQWPWKELVEEERQSPYYRHRAAIPLIFGTHGGEDVAVYATGPGASLISGVFEQNYVAYALSYAACMGPVWVHHFDHTCNILEKKSSYKKLSFKRT